MWERSTGTEEIEESPQRLGRRDVINALLICLGGLALYSGTMQDDFFGDGSQLVEQFAMGLEDGELKPWMHVLYLPLGWVCQLCLPGYQPVLALQVVAALGGASALGGAYLIARRFGARRGGAAFGAALLAFAPAHWFFSTTVEIHALHAGVVALSACVTVFVPWRRPFLAMVMSSIPFALVYLSHKSGVLLFPGWVLLILAAAQRQQVRLPRYMTYAAILLHLLALLGAMMFADSLTSKAGDLGIGATLSFMASLFDGVHWELLGDGIVWPLALFLPIALLGGFTPIHSRLLRWTLITMLLPVCGFILLVFGDPNRGGYLLGVAPVLVVLVAAAFDRWWRVAPWPLVLVLLSELAIGTSSVVLSANPARVERRLQQLAIARSVLPANSVVVCFDPHNQTIAGVYPDLHVMNLWFALQELRRAGLSTEEASQQMLLHLAHAMQTHQRQLALDLGYRRFSVLSAGDLAVLDALVGAVRRLGPDRRVLAGQTGEGGGYAYLLLWN